MLKRIELAWRGLLIRVLTRMMRQDRAKPDWGNRPHRVLFLRPDRVGDMIVTTGVFRAIATSHETIQLDVLASPGNAAILDGNPHIRRVRVFDRGRPWTWPRLVRELRGARYDAVIDCMVFSPSLTLLLLMAASGAALRIGVGGRMHDAVYGLPVNPTPRPQAHHIEHLGALALAFGVDDDPLDWRPEIFLSRQELDTAEEVWRQHALRQAQGERKAACELTHGHRGRRLLVNISTAKGRRWWPEERFISVIGDALLRRPDLRVLLIGMAQHERSLRRIAEETGCAVVTPGLRQTFAMVATADVLLTPDTGLVHAASAFRTPVVVMYLRGKSEHWAPYRTASRILSSPDKSLLSLPAEPVSTALAELLDSLEVAAGDPGGFTTQSDLADNAGS